MNIKCDWCGKDLHRLENLQVFSSQAEHARWHAQHKEVVSK